MEIGCGFALRIASASTGFKLHSHHINYGTGSGQQVVSTINEMNDPGSLWVIKEPFGERPCTTGKRVACGQRIRLEHLTSGRNLHSDKEFQSPLGNKQEVSVFGFNGNGDISDDWIIECADDGQDFLKGSTIFYLRHAETEDYLYTDNQFTYTQENCRNCPIIGQREVSAAERRDKFCEWQIVGVNSNKSIIFYREFSIP